MEIILKKIEEAVDRSSYTNTSVDDTGTEGATVPDFTYQGITYPGSTFKQVKPNELPLHLRSFGSAEGSLYLATFSKYDQVALINEGGAFKILTPKRKVEFAEPYDLDSDMIKISRQDFDFEQAGWYHFATYTQASDKVNSLLARLSIGYQGGAEVDMLYVPLNKTYYTEKQIPESIKKEIALGLVKPSLDYNTAKSDKFDEKEMRAKLMGLWRQGK